MTPDRNYALYSKDFYEEIQEEFEMIKPRICPCCGQVIKKNITYGEVEYENMYDPDLYDLNIEKERKI